MLRGLSFVGFNLIAFLANYANGRKNVLASREKFYTPLTDLTIDILIAAEKLQYQSWDINQIRKDYNDIKVQITVSDQDIEATLALSDDGINKADLIKKMCALCITHKLSSFELSMDNALKFVRQKICNEDDKDSFYDYLDGKDGAKDCSQYLSTEQQATLKELKDKYNERSKLIKSMDGLSKPHATRMLLCTVGSVLLSTAAFYHKPLIACINASEYKKLALVCTSSAAVLWATILFMEDVTLLWHKRGYCNGDICKEKIFPHIPVTATFAAGLAASVGAGSYVASMV